MSVRISEKAVMAEFREKMNTEAAKQIHRKRGPAAAQLLDQRENRPAKVPLAGVATPSYASGSAMSASAEHDVS